MVRFGREAGDGAIYAIDPFTGEKAWSNRMHHVSDSGLLTTASDLLFSGNREGHFFALDAKTGKLLWRRLLGGQVAASPITYLVDGTQHVSIASGSSLFTFALHKIEVLTATSNSRRNLESMLFALVLFLRLNR